MKYRPEEHHVMVSKLAKDPQAIAAFLTAHPNVTNMLHAAMIISKEAGELLDAVYRLAVYENPMTDAAFTNIIEELGDIEFGMSLLRQQLGITRDTTIRASTDKLNKRYSEGKFSEAQATARADKVEEVKIFQNMCIDCGVLIGASYTHCELHEPKKSVSAEAQIAQSEAPALGIASLATRLPDPVEFQQDKYLVITQHDLQILADLGYSATFGVMLTGIAAERRRTAKLKPNYVVISDEFPGFYDEIKEEYMKVIAETLANRARQVAGELIDYNLSNG
jgi:hypothetical protein